MKHLVFNLSKRRGLLRLKGEDTSKLLQSLVAQDMRFLYKEDINKSDKFRKLHLKEVVDLNEKRGLFSCFLNAKGRILFDCFLLKENQQQEKDSLPSLLIETDKQLLPSLLKYLQLHKLRSKVQIEDLSSPNSSTPSLQIYSLVASPSFPNPFQHIPQERWAEDERMGESFRVYCSSLQHLNSLLQPPQQVEEVEEVVYRMVRRLSGVLEGVEELGSGETVPFDANFDVHNCISHTKGCYIGQELVNRTFTVGIVRKRILPCFVSSTPPSSQLHTPTHSLQQWLENNQYNSSPSSSSSSSSSSPSSFTFSLSSFLKQNSPSSAPPANSSPSTSPLQNVELRTLQDKKVGKLQTLEEGREGENSCLLSLASVRLENLSSSTTSPPLFKATLPSSSTLFVEFPKTPFFLNLFPSSSDGVN